MLIGKLRNKKVLTTIILLSLSLAIASIIVKVNEQKPIDRIYSREGSFSYNSNPNKPFHFYEVRVEIRNMINYMEMLMNDSLPFPMYWGVNVDVYDENNERIEGNRIGDVYVYRCLTRNMTFTAYQISYLLVEFSIEVEAFYYEASPILLYLFLTFIFVWINYVSYVLIKRKKQTEKWFKPFRK